MALSRRSGQRFEANIWPGFVDALTALLLILMFVLSIFMIVQFSLRETITGQSQRLNDLTAQLSSISDVLSLEKARSAELEGELGTLRATLVDERAEASRLEAALAALSQQRDAALGRVAELESERDAATTALASARSEIDAQAEAARLAAARREAMEALVAQLQADTTAQADEITTLTTDRASALALIASLREEQAALADELGDTAAEKSELEKARAELEALRAEALANLDATEAQLTAAEEARLLEAAAAEALRKKLEEDAAELDAVTLAVEQARTEAEQTLTLLAAAEAARLRLQEDLTRQGQDSASLQAQLAAEAQLREDAGAAFDQEAILRKIAEAELAKASEQTAEQARRVALLSAQVNELNRQLSSLQQLLDETAEKEADGQVQISDLGSRLNAALARKVALESENAALLAQQVDALERVRSIFLERVEAALAGRDGIRRVGDRFVFQSEVLFNPGSAVLGPEGRAELAKLGEILRDVSRDLPEDVNWILRIDGHTDRIPLSGQGRYRNNWELSQGRALSVVTYLVDQEGADPTRLAATGFGEYQPIADGSDPADLARNRRIEFKFTER